jgi:hypothetical protein
MSDVIVPGWYREQWDKQTIIKFQNRGYVLKGTTAAPLKIEGTKFKFLRTDLMEAQQFTKGDTVVGLNPDDDTVEMESTEWDAAFHLYDWDVTRLPVAEVDARQQQAANAIGRRADRIIYDAIMAATIDGSQVFGAYTDPFDPYTFLSGLEKLADNDVDTADGGIFAPIPSKAFYQLKTYKIWSNSQWIGGDLPLKKMVQHQAFDVANAFVLPAHLRKAYTANTTEVRFRIWHKSAIGAGHNQGLRTEWEREAKKKRWFVNHTIDGCAVAVQPAGIIEYRFKLDSPIEDEIQRTQAVA